MALNTLLSTKFTGQYAYRAAYPQTRLMVSRVPSPPTICGSNTMWRFRHRLLNVGKRYASFSIRRPFLAAAFTAGSILTGADLFSQSLECSFGGKPFEYDLRRTMSLAAFGFLYYGGPVKLLYLMYDKFFRTAAMKVMFDVGVHTPFMLIPMFYGITCTVKGKPMSETWKQLKEEWKEASLGSIGFWLPTCFVNFALVPQHSRILVISVMSFFHKTWLSWVSNRRRKQESELADQHDPFMEAIQSTVQEVSTTTKLAVEAGLDLSMDMVVPVAQTVGCDGLWPPLLQEYGRRWTRAAQEHCLCFAEIMEFTI